MKDYTIGKTPLGVRIERYLDSGLMLPDQKYIPIHPKEYAALAEKASFSGVYKDGDEQWQILPLGSRI